MLLAIVAKFKSVGTTPTDQNSMAEEIKRKIKFQECLSPFGPESFVFPRSI
jgi:hypothetical protein